ncbi:lytic transglycosylase domain-containing protein [Candidatus Frankia nodulisporulans]|nr:lytic murein transglycosylase [Candidatus Frankia nodulisporulans]
MRPSGGRRAAGAWPGCHLRWQLLAGIGRVESGHGVGRAIATDGTITSAILGPALDGQDGRALVRDTDSGRLDGDRRFDRAVGPMQFIPTTWAWAGRDGSGDGRADPNNVDDAALAAAGYLCGHRHDLAEPVSLRSAILSYNPSDSYVRAVLAWSAAYTTIGALPGPTVATPAAPPPSSRRRPHQRRRPPRPWPHPWRVRRPRVRPRRLTRRQPTHPAGRRRLIRPPIRPRTRRRDPRRHLSPRLSDGARSPLSQRRPAIRRPPRPEQVRRTRPVPRSRPTMRCSSLPSPPRAARDLPARRPPPP